jgi:hypothetical protein
MAARTRTRARWRLADYHLHRTGIVMSCFQRVRHPPGVLARDASDRVAGDRRAAMRRAGDLAAAGGRSLGVAIVLAAPLLLAGSANAIAAASPDGNGPVVSAWNAAVPDTALAMPRAEFPGGAAKTGGTAGGERVAWELPGLRARGRNAPVLITTPAAPGARLPALPAPAPRLDGATLPAVNSATRFALPPSPSLGSGHYPRAFIDWKLSARPPRRCAPPRPPAHASGYPRAFVGWKLSAGLRARTPHSKLVGAASGMTQ